MYCFHYDINYFNFLYIFSFLSTALTKLVWNLVGEDLAKLLGYRSSKAFQSFSMEMTTTKLFSFAKFYFLVQVVYVFYKKKLKNKRHFITRVEGLMRVEHPLP